MEWSAYLGDAAVARSYNERLVCMSTAIIRAIEMCFGLVSEGNKGFVSLMLISARLGGTGI